MKSKLVHDENGLKTFVVVFDSGDEVRQNLLEFANSNRLTDAHLTAIGALSQVKLGFFDRQQKAYKEIPLQEQVEVLSLTGNIVPEDGKPRLHAHVVVGKSDGTAHGGHFLGGRVWPTPEMIISELPLHLRRSHDEESGWHSSISPPEQFAPFRLMAGGKCVFDIGVPRDGRKDNWGADKTASAI
jgi:predicted DNA-binding protein with PD1-like motif